jgi:hypothetical protein
LNYLSLVHRCEEELALFAQSEDDFSRDRKLPLRHLVGSLLHKSAGLPGRGYELICAAYFASLKRSDEIARLARSSYCEARDKLSWEAFAYLLDKSNLEQADNFKAPRWKGHRVRAVDGSCIQLPRSEEILSTFPVRIGGFGTTHYPYAYLVIAADVFTCQTTHSLLGNKYSSERDQLRDLLKTFDRNDIAILDRGFDGKNVWVDFQNAGQNFVGRLNARNGHIKRFNPKLRDQMITVEDGDKHIQVRIIRGPKFKTGSYLFLATSLTDSRRYERKAILELYKKRQAVEEVFLHLKNTMHAKNIRSKKLNGVLQEIYAALVMTTIAAGIRYLFELKARSKRISFKAICWRLDSAIGILLAQYSIRKLNRIFRGLCSFNHNPQPGRSFPRWSRQPESKWIKAKRRKS